MSAHQQTAEFVVEPEDEGVRLDVFLARRFPDRSRVQIRKAIVADGVTVDGERTKVAYRLVPGQVIRVNLPEIPRDQPIAEDIPLDILFEDEHLVAVNKPSGMVVHPAKGHWSGTLTAALAFRFERLSTVGGTGRPGIVHRLDRDTSGVIVVAKTDAAHLKLSQQFADRTTQKQYVALVAGELDRDRDIIRAAIGAHPHQREKMAAREGHSTSRDAETFYEVAQRFPGFAVVNVFPKTGRTHQIRVHLAHAGHPILADPLYSGRDKITRADLGTGGEEDVLIDRTALHAARLRLSHPASGEELDFSAPLPTDMASLLAELKGMTSSESAGRSPSS